MDHWPLGLRGAHAIPSGVLTAAIFGLVVVTIGGLINAAVAARQARRADRASARTAAAHQEGRQQCSGAAWHAYRDAVARALSDEDWDVLTQAYEVIEGSDTHVIAQATAPKADPKASVHPTRSDDDLVLDAYSRMQRIGLPSRQPASARPADRGPARPSCQNG
jgi:hypothetical protein